MNQVHSQAPVVAVLRGGVSSREHSIASGLEVLTSMTKLGMPTVDIYIDETGVWHRNGLTVESHAIFSVVDGYIDLVEDKDVPYRALAKAMRVPKLLFNTTDTYKQDRESLYRILRQKGVRVPDTSVLRARNGVSLSALQSIWKSLHTPYLIRPIDIQAQKSSALLSSFDDFHTKVMDYVDSGLDVHILSYRNEPTISTAVLPEYRGERLYIPLSVTSLIGKREVPNVSSKIVLHKMHSAESSELRDILIKTYDALLLTEPVLIDVIKTKNGFMVVEVQTKPSLRKDGRFIQSLKSTGVEIAHFLQHILNEPKRS